jgi:hypothetical protein
VCHGDRHGHGRQDPPRATPRPELTERGWTAEIGDRADRPILHVRNPHVPQLNDKIVCSGARYRWSWGADIGPVDDVREAADRVVFVLREIT